MKIELPRSVQTTLWSYNTNKLDVKRDKERIIQQTLNNGSLEAVEWLKQAYSKEELQDTIRQSSAGEWSKKSLNYWSLMLDSTPERVGRFS